MCRPQPLSRHHRDGADEALAGRLDVAPERIAFGTGSVAVLFHLLNVLGRPGAEVVYAFRSFEAYPIATQLSGATGVPVPLTPAYEHDLDAMLAAMSRLRWPSCCARPNNPTGPVLRQLEVEAFLDRVPDDVAVVVDEAYVEFVDNPAAVGGLSLLDRPNVIVLRTFSKAYGLAGLRIGYCVASPELAGVIRAAANPFGVTTIAQAAALASLAAEDALRERVDELVVRRAAMLKSLRDLGHDVPRRPGQLRLAARRRSHPPLGERVRRRRGDGPPVRLRRPAGEPGPFDGIRITVGEPEANDLALLVAAGLTHP